MSATRCPECRALAGHMTLLTSMVTYFGCTQCAHRWQLVTPRGKTPVPDAVVEAPELDVRAPASIDDGLVRQT